MKSLFDIENVIPEDDYDPLGYQSSSEWEDNQYVSRIIGDSYGEE